MESLIGIGCFILGSVWGAAVALWSHQHWQKVVPQVQTMLSEKAEVVPVTVQTKEQAKPFVPEKKS